MTGYTLCSAQALTFRPPISSRSSFTSSLTRRIPTHKSVSCPSGSTLLLTAISSLSNAVLSRIRSGFLLLSTLFTVHIPTPTLRASTTRSRYSNVTPLAFAISAVSATESSFAHPLSARRDRKKGYSASLHTPFFYRFLSFFILFDFLSTPTIDIEPIFLTKVQSAASKTLE